MNIYLQLIQQTEINLNIDPELVRCLEGVICMIYNYIYIYKVYYIYNMDIYIKLSNIPQRNSGRLSINRNHNAVLCWYK